jgi:hypothetical protein
MIGAAGGLGSNKVTVLGNVNGQLTPVKALVTVIAVYTPLPKLAIVYCPDALVVMLAGATGIPVLV